MLEGPPFPRSLYYLFDWFAELVTWCDDRPTWRELQPWMAAMNRVPSGWELRALKQISNAFFAAQVPDGN